jgi:glycosyltransferase involved in cell wall biosynthesis
MGEPLISVIIPCYNMGRFLPEAVESILAQAHRNWEVIVVDDGSTDDTEAVVRGLPLPVRYLRQENRGPAAARNRGLEAASADLIAFLDTDDCWAPAKTELQLPHLAAGTPYELVVGYQQFFRDKPGEPEGSRNYEYLPPFFVFLFGCGLYRRTVFEKVGLPDEAMRFSEDTDWFFRVREAEVPLKLLKETCVFYRRHSGGMTHGRDPVSTGFMGALHKSLWRRRSPEGGRAKDLSWLFGQVASPEELAAAQDQRERLRQWQGKKTRNE